MKYANGISLIFALAMLAAAAYQNHTTYNRNATLAAQLTAKADAYEERLARVDQMLGHFYNEQESREQRLETTVATIRQVNDRSYRQLAELFSTTRSVVKQKRCACYDTQPTID